MNFLISSVILAVFLYTLGCATLPKETQTPRISDEKTSAFKFDDTQLKNYLHKHPQGIIYIFSPQMPLSLLGLKEYKAIAAKQGLGFLPLLSPTTAPGLDLRHEDLSGVAILASQELIARDATQHFPAFLFYKQGHLHGRFNPGYEAPEIFQAKLIDFLNSPNQASDSAHFQSSMATDKNRLPAMSCDAKALGQRREIILPVVPTFFIRVDTDSRKIFMSGECVISLNNGSCLSRGRTWEAYPVAGFDMITIPSCDREDGLCFYDTRTYKNQEVSKPFFFDPEMRGYYQSLGFLKRSETTADIRVINYYGFMRDYRIKRGHVEALSPLQKFCSGKFARKLPMISKDGRYFSGWDDVNQKTVIYSLHEDGSCTEVMSFDTMFSKMDWSYDSKYVAFHLSTLPSGKITEDFPFDVIKQDLYLLELKTKRITKISFGPNLLYYPHFGRNGLLYALKTAPKSDKFSVLEIDPRKALSDPKALIATCKDCQNEDIKTLADMSCQPSP